MKRPFALLLLLAVSVAAGVWLFAPAEQERASQDSCNGSDSCSASDSPLAANEPPATEAGESKQARAAPSAAAPTPAPGSGALAGTQVPAPTSNSSPPAAAADGVRLRAEADRLIAEGHVPEGIDAMRKATEADPSARNHGDLGALLERLTAMDEALVHLRRAADLDPGNADRWIALANAYYRVVDPGAAWKAERRAREAEPGLVLGRDASGRRVREDDSAAGKK